jgi:hypothetical protein
MYESALNREISEKEKSLVMGGNIARILRLEASGPA